MIQGETPLTMSTCTYLGLTIAFPGAHFDTLGVPRLGPLVRVPCNLNCLNRRMRTRMSGGVGGLGSAISPPYPD
ncbi:hypothetical protein BH09GEM1_BH09GEM1_05280 [soil metagenome]